MLSRIFSYAPKFLTGGVDAKADKEATSWAAQNHTRSLYRYGFIGRQLVRGTEKPVLFALAIAAVCGAVAGGAAALACFYHWKIPAPTKGDFDVPAFMGVAWTVQATLLALVYPIVLAFIALLLQRKVHATSLLRVYLLESGIVPAGASSVGLLIVMGATYYLSPYYPPNLLGNPFAFVILFHAIWLMLNIGLTGMFLGLTIRFIQDGQQRNAYVKAAVDIALRAELKMALKQHLLIKAAQDDWRLPGIESDDKALPYVFNFALAREPVSVSKKLKGNSSLDDVQLNLLRYVAKRWHKRALAVTTRDPQRRAALLFPAQFGDVRSDSVPLCIIENGPALKRHERWLVRLAYSYRSSSQSGNGLSTKAMLEEFGADVLLAAEQRRFDAAESGMRQLVKLHKTLLHACAVEIEGQYLSAATIGIAPGSFRNESFDQTWLQPYRDLSRVAVSYLDEDERLFRFLSYVSGSIASEVSPTPEQLSINAQLVGTHLFYHLEKWWKKKIDAAFSFDKEKFVGLLPAPERATYDRALLAFISHWGNLRIYLPKESEKTDAQKWSEIRGRALVYARHIENSATLFVKAISRQDETAADRLLDSFLKWWGTRETHFEVRNLLRNVRFAGANIELATKSWEEMIEAFRDGDSSISVDFASSAMSIGLKRYWEDVRLFLIAYLLESAGKSPLAGCRELRYVSTLLTRTPQFRGGNVGASSLNQLDEILNGILRTSFASVRRVSRIDAFAEELSHLESDVEVTSWTYMRSGVPSTYESMTHAHAVLLVAAAKIKRNLFSSCKTFIEGYWDDVDKLADMEKFLDTLRRKILSSSFVENTPAVMQLQNLLNTDLRVRTARRVISTALKNLKKTALRERSLALQSLPLDDVRVNRMRHQCSEILFDTSLLPSVVKSLTFSTKVNAVAISSEDHCSRRPLQARIGYDDNSDIAEQAANTIRHDVFKDLFAKLIGDAALKSFGLDLENYDVGCVESKNFLIAVDAECQRFRSRGDVPLILCGQSAESYLLDESAWWMGTCPLPAGFSLKRLEDPARKDLRGTFNDVEIFDFPTPNGACYVVASSMVRGIVVQGRDASSTLTMELSEEDVNLLKMKFTLVVGFSQR